MCQQVLGADALATDFPACSIASPYNTFLEMREDLAAFLEQASGESIREFAATSFKAGESSRELRDTTDVSSHGFIFNEYAYVALACLDY